MKRPVRPAWPALRRGDESLLFVLATVLAVVATAVALLGLLLHRVPTPWKPTILVTTFARYLMWAAPPAVVIAALGRRWTVLGVAAAASVLALFVQLPACVATTAPRDGTPVVVMQANLRLGSADPDAIVGLVSRHGVDLLATEELTDSAQQGLLDAGIAERLPHHYTAPAPDGDGSGLGIWSRYPLRHTVTVPGYVAGVVHVTVSLPGGQRPTFAAVHLLPPYPFPAGTWRREITSLQGTLAGLPRAAPVLVAGDFNATTDHEQFRALLRNGYGDASDQAGAGYVSTFPADRWFGPLVGIDHVLTRGAVATSLDAVALPDSDHLGLVTRVVLRRG